MGVRNSSVFFSSTRAKGRVGGPKDAAEPHPCSLPLLWGVCALLNKGARSQPQGQTKLTVEGGSTTAHIFKREEVRQHRVYRVKGCGGTQRQEDCCKFEEHALQSKIQARQRYILRSCLKKQNNNKFRKEKYLKLSQSYRMPNFSWSTKETAAAPGN